MARWRRVSVPALALAAALAPAAAAHPAVKRPPEGTITVGIVGDQTLSVDLEASYGVLARGVQALADAGVDLVLHTGDLVESSRGPAEVTALFEQAAGILDRLPVPWFLAAGDHDVNPPAFEPDSPDRSREALFQRLYGRRVPAFAERPYYSFDVGGFHFVALYSHQALHADPRFGNVFLARIGEDQLAWLAADLDAHRDARGVVVFLHQPLWYHWSGWQPVHELLARHRVAVVVSGHTHYDQDGGVIDGVRYLTVGATGGATRRGSRDAGDVHHVTVLRLAGREVRDVELISLSDDLPLALTPRADMDRVQALDVQLGNLFDFARRNPVFVQDGELVDACEGGRPATVEITQLGAPIDRPVEVTLAFASEPPAVALDGPAFTPGQCRSTVGTLRCVLARTARTLVSNPSSVLIDELAAPPLWTAGLAPADGVVEPGTVLRFDVRTAFDGDSGPLFVETTVSTTVRGCP